MVTTVPSIRTLPSGNFQAAVLMPNGKRETKAFPTEDEALDWAIQQEARRDMKRQAREWDLPTTSAVTVDEAVERFLEAARVIKVLLVEQAGATGRWGVTARFANEQILYSINIGHQILTGAPLPQEFILAPGEHFESNRGHAR